MQSKPWQIEWSDALSMSNPEIDAEHQHFIALVNELNNAIFGKQEKAEIQYVLYLILEDAIAHFVHEEQLFTERAYPRAQEHAQLHTEIIDSFQQTLNRIQQTEYNRDWIDIGLNIRNLLVEHVLSEDTKYIDYLRTM